LSAVLKITPLTSTEIKDLSLNSIKKSQLVKKLKIRAKFEAKSSNESTILTTKNRKTPTEIKDLSIFRGETENFFETHLIGALK
jgi:hypothetical protein